MRAIGNYENRHLVTVCYSGASPNLLFLSQRAFFHSLVFYSLDLLLYCASAVVDHSTTTIIHDSDKNPIT